MAFDERLTERIRAALGSHQRISENKMFGGLAFMIGNKLFCGIVGDDLLVRLGPARYEECLALPHVREMDFSGKPMKGYVFVSPSGLRTTKSLQRWIDLGIDSVSITGKEQPKARRGRLLESGHTGFSVTMRADDDGGLERLAHYLLRPPLSLERLTLEPGLAR